MKLNLEIYRSIPGLKLPNPLPPIPEIIARLRTLIAQTESRQRQLAGLDVNKCNDDALLAEAATIKSYLSILKLRLAQLLEAYPEDVSAPNPTPSMQSIKSMPSISPEQKNKNTPGCVPNIDDQQQSSNGDASGSVPHPSQSVPNPSETEPKASETDPNPSQNVRDIFNSLFDSTKSNSGSIPENLNELAIEFRDLRDKRSPLDHLTDEEHDAIIELLEHHSYVAVAQLLAQPRPIGLELKTSDGSLKRFIKRRQKNQRRKEQREKLAHAQQITTQSGADGYVKASAYMLESRLLKTATDDQADPQQLQLLTKTLTTLRRQTLAERQQTHREQSSTP